MYSESDFSLQVTAVNTNLTDISKYNLPQPSVRNTYFKHIYYVLQGLKYVCFILKYPHVTPFPQVSPQ